MRNDESSEFGKRYADYWDTRESNRTMRRIMQRQD